MSWYATVKTLMELKHGMKVRIGGKIATVVGSARVGDDIIVLWVRCGESETALRGKELKNVEVVKNETCVLH